MEYTLIYNEFDLSSIRLWRSRGQAPLAGSKEQPLQHLMLVDLIFGNQKNSKGYKTLVWGGCVEYTLV